LVEINIVRFRDWESLPRRQSPVASPQNDMLCLIKPSCLPNLQQLGAGCFITLLFLEAFLDNASTPRPLLLTLHPLNVRADRLSDRIVGRLFLPARK
jgi:hypothetical protein